MRLIRLTVEAPTPFLICVNSARVKDGGVALEHLFGEAGYIDSKLRARLSPDNVNKLVFLARNENLRLGWLSFINIV